MAFDAHSLKNYEVLVPLSLDYSRETVAQVTALLSQFRYTRHATKTYRFLGMTEAAVKKCLAEKRRQYMRRFVAWRVSNRQPFRMPLSQDYFEQVAQFNVSKREVVYDLQITVDEIVHLYSTAEFDPKTEAGCQGIERLFQFRSVTPNSWVWQYKYDEPEDL